MPEQTRYVNNVFVGEWTNPANAFADDDLCTTTSVSRAENYYDFTNNPFTIPAGATITGLLLRLRWGGDGNDECYLYLYDDLSEWRGVYGTPSVHLCADAVLAQAGGDGDLWGGTWTPAHINSGDFKCLIRYFSKGKAGTMYVDFVYVTVYYTVPADPYDTNVRLIGTVIALYSAPVRNVGAVIVPFSTLVRLIGSVHRSYSTQARLIGTVLLTFSTQVRNMGLIYRSFSAQVRNVGILLPRIVDKCHAKLRVR